MFRKDCYLYGAVLGRVDLFAVFRAGGGGGGHRPYRIVGQFRDVNGRGFVATGAFRGRFAVCGFTRNAALYPCVCNVFMSVRSRSRSGLGVGSSLAARRKRKRKHKR